MITIESRGNLAVEIPVGYQISRHLMKDELIKWHVGIQGLDQPISPDPHVSKSIILIAVGIGIP